MIHDRYSKTFEMMREGAAVINWRALTALNVDGYVQDRPGVFMLAHTNPHDANRVKAPYHYQSVEDLRAALAAMVRPEDPELARQADRGARWFKLEYLPVENHEARLAELKDYWESYEESRKAHGHGHVPALEHKGSHD